jgi:predicted Zn-dependent peptidase
MRSMLIRTMMTAAALGLGGMAHAQADLPAHPDELTFPALSFEPPRAADFRHELTSGVPVFLAPSREFPLITVTFTFRGGTYLEGPDEAGHATGTGAMMRAGGTTTISAADLDERFDFLAAEVSSFVGTEESAATINCLKSNFDESFALFLDMVRNPGFDAERLRVQKAGAIEQLKQRNDAPMSVATVHMGRLLFGPDHYNGRKPTLASVQSMTPETLRAMHRRIFHPGNLVISATGDFEPAEMLARLETAIADWPVGPTAGDPPGPTQPVVPGLYHADVAQRGIPQGVTLVVGRSIKRDDPDTIALTLMNHILGGGGFTSRITNRVRSDEGLAYAAATFLQPQVYYPGLFGGFLQSKNATVGLATRIMLDEMERIRVEPVTGEELRTAQNALIEKLPQQFATKAGTLAVLVRDELTRRPAGYWQRYRDAVRAVTPDEVRRVAERHVDPSRMVVLVIGDWEAIYEGNLEGRGSMSQVFGGAVSHLPTLDPLTLEPVTD